MVSPVLEEPIPRLIFTSYFQPAQFVSPVHESNPQKKIVGPAIKYYIRVCDGLVCYQMAAYMASFQPTV